MLFQSLTYYAKFGGYYSLTDLCFPKFNDYHALICTCSSWISDPTIMFIYSRVDNCIWTLYDREAQWLMWL